MTSRWLSIGNAALYTGFSPATLRRYEAEGHLTSIRTPGGHRRYTRTDLDAFLEQRLDVLEYRKRKRRNLLRWRRERDRVIEEEIQHRLATLR